MFFSNVLVLVVGAVIVSARAIGDVKRESSEFLFLRISGHHDQFMDSQAGNRCDASLSVIQYLVKSTPAQI